MATYTNYQLHCMLRLGRADAKYRTIGLSDRGGEMQFPGAARLSSLTHFIIIVFKGRGFLDSNVTAILFFFYL